MKFATRFVRCSVEVLKHLACSMWCKEERKFELVIYSNTQNDDSIREIHTCTSDCDYVISCRRFRVHVLEN